MGASCIKLERQLRVVKKIFFDRRHWPSAQLKKGPLPTFLIGNF